MWALDELACSEVSAQLDGTSTTTETQRDRQLALDNCAHTTRCFEFYENTQKRATSRVVKIQTDFHLLMDQKVDLSESLLMSK